MKKDGRTGGLEVGVRGSRPGVSLGEIARSFALTPPIWPAAPTAQPRRRTSAAVLAQESSPVRAGELRIRPGGDSGRLAVTLAQEGVPRARGWSPHRSEGALQQGLPSRLPTRRLPSSPAVAVFPPGAALPCRSPRGRCRGDPRAQPEPGWSRSDRSPTSPFLSGTSSLRVCPEPSPRGWSPRRPVPLRSGRPGPRSGLFAASPPRYSSSLAFSAFPQLRAARMVPDPPAPPVPLLPTCEFGTIAHRQPRRLSSGRRGGQPSPLQPGRKTRNRRRAATSCGRNDVE